MALSVTSSVPPRAANSWSAIMQRLRYTRQAGRSAARLAAAALGTTALLLSAPGAAHAAEPEINFPDKTLAKNGNQFPVKVNYRCDSGASYTYMDVGLRQTKNYNNVARGSAGSSPHATASPSPPGSKSRRSATFFGQVARTSPPASPSTGDRLTTFIAATWEERKAQRKNRSRSGSPIHTGQASPPRCPSATDRPPCPGHPVVAGHGTDTDEVGDHNGRHVIR